MAEKKKRLRRYETAILIGFCISLSIAIVVLMFLLEQRNHAEPGEVIKPLVGEPISVEEDSIAGPTDATMEPTKSESLTVVDVKEYMGISEEDLYLLSKAVYCFVGNGNGVEDIELREAQYLTAKIIMNRLENSTFECASITDVLKDSNQFPGVLEQLDSVVELDKELINTVRMAVCDKEMPKSLLYTMRVKAKDFYEARDICNANLNENWFMYDCTDMADEYIFFLFTTE